MSLYAMSKDIPSSRRTGVRAFAVDMNIPQETPQPQKPAEKAVDALTKFIPTELLAPYVTALSLSKPQEWDPIRVYLWFIIATPIVYLIYKYAQAASDNAPWPDISPLIWRTFGATFAFIVWGLSVPTNPLQNKIGGAAVAGFLAMIVSPILTALDTIILRVLKKIAAPKPPAISPPVK